MKISIKPAKLEVTIKTERVNPMLEDVEITPTTEEQKIKSKNYYGYNEVTVKPVTADIDSNIIPENIKKGTSILGVEGECKGEVETNVFMQETEPEKKDGIWLQGNYEVENIIADTNIMQSAQYNSIETNKLRAIPYEHYQGNIAEVGTDIYLFGSTANSSNKKEVYRYNSLTDTYTQLDDVPYDFYYSVAKAIGTDIYLFGTYGTNGKYTYRYDTLTGTFTKLTNMAYSFYGGSGEVVGNNVYLFGNAGSSSYRTYAYIYNTKTNTYTKLTNIPVAFNNGATAVIGTDIYLFGGVDNPTKAYKYDTTSNSYTLLATIPYSFSKGGAKAVGTDIYLFGGENSKTYVYKYDTLTDTYTQLTNLGYSFYNGSVGTAGLNIYLFGGKDYPKKVQVVSINTKEYPNKSILISQDENKYSTNIADIGISNLKTYYDKVYYNNNNGEILTNISVYNGDGTTWIRI